MAGVRRSHGDDSVCLVATQLTEDGVIRQLTPQASITFGELDGQASTRIEDIANGGPGGGFGRPAWYRKSHLTGRRAS